MRTKKSKGFLGKKHGLASRKLEPEQTKREIRKAHGNCSRKKAIEIRKSQFGI